MLERDEAGGGLVRFGVPEFKIEKRLVERRLDQLVDEGVEFRYGVDVGVDIGADELRATYDAVVRRDGLARPPRPAGARAASSTASTSRWTTSTTAPASIAAEVGTAGQLAPPPAERPITAAGKHVIVIGGGDTGADCVANAHRESAASVTQIEVLGEPPVKRPGRPHAVAAVADEAPHLVRAEGGRRPRLRDLDDAPLGLERRGRADPLGAERRRAAVRPARRARRSRARPSSSSSRWGSSTPSSGVLEQLGVERDARGNAAAPAYATSVDGVFAAGDARRGQSLVVWAINEGRQCAEQVDGWLAANGLTACSDAPEGSRVRRTTVRCSARPVSAHVCRRH